MKKHSWNLTPKEAIALQQQWRECVVCEDQFGPVQYVAGVDVGFEDNNQVTRAAIVVLKYPSLEPVDCALARIPTSYPYIPGLLSFRELPAVLQAWEQLTTKPDLLLCDGQGQAHPRRFGIACHLGVWLGIATIGVGKTRLVGQFDNVPNQKGAWVPLCDREEVVGAVLRTRQNVKPIFVSVGHKVCLASAITWVMNCITRYKLPETTRYAHHVASNLK